MLYLCRHQIAYCQTKFSVTSLLKKSFPNPTEYKAILLQRAQMLNLSFFQYGIGMCQIYRVLREFVKQVYWLKPIQDPSHSFVIQINLTLYQIYAT